MIEVRFHGRGGQGVVTAARILSNAFLKVGKFGSSFPMFGFERRGAPVTAFMRFDDRRIREKTQIYNPDCVIVLDPSQKRSSTVYEGMKPGGRMILNAAKGLGARPHPNIEVCGVINAQAIALEELGFPSPNTCIVGAFASATGWIDLDAVMASLEQFFEGESLKKNMRSAERGYREVEVIRW